MTAAQQQHAATTACEALAATTTMQQQQQHIHRVQDPPDMLAAATTMQQRTCLAIAWHSTGGQTAKSNTHQPIRDTGRADHSTQLRWNPIQRAGIRSHHLAAE